MERVDDISGGEAIGYVGGAFLLIFFLVIACLAQDWALNLLYVLVPLVTGWASGILFTPQDEPQSAQFQSIAGGVAALFTGFVIGRFEPVLEPFKNPNTWNVLYQERIGMAIGSFILGALFTGIGRIRNINPFKK